MTGIDEKVQDNKKMWGFYSLDYQPGKFPWTEKILRIYGGLMKFFSDDGLIIPHKTLIRDGSRAVSVRFIEGYEPGVPNPESLPHYDMTWEEWVEKGRPVKISNP